MLIQRLVSDREGTSGTGNCQSVRNGYTQTAPARASFILGHPVLGWGVAQLSHQPEVLPLSGHSPSPSERHLKPPIIPEVEQEHHLAANIGERLGHLRALRASRVALAGHFKMLR